MNTRISVLPLVFLAVSLPLSAVSQNLVCQTSQTELVNILATYKALNGTNIPGSLDLFGTAAYWINENAKAIKANSAAKAPAQVSTAQASTTQARTDQQTTAPAAASGSTSTTSKGSVPWLLGLAEEYGGLTQSVSGSVTTVNGNIPNMIKAFSTKSYQKSFDAWPNNQFLTVVEKASFSLSFNTGSSSSSTSSSTTASPSTFGSATAHIDLINHRDPRDNKWREAWAGWINAKTTNLPDAVQDFLPVISTTYHNEYSEWQGNTRNTLSSLESYLKTTKDASTLQDTQISTKLDSIWTDFNTKVCAPVAKDPTLLQAGTKYSTALDAYQKGYQSVQSDINQSPVFSFEYTFTNQSSVALPKSTTQTYAIGTTAPNLSTFNFIYQRSLSKNGGAQLTANASTTLFTSPSAQLHVTPVRDYKLSAEADFPLPSLDKLSKSTLSLSALVQDLLQEPLGQQVTVNGVSVTNTGTIVLGQVKWTFPAGTSGITFPISFTASNRTDLIKESTVKGTIGVSYNLDSLFSQLK
jgi:hypothetical protein